MTIASFAAANDAAPPDAAEVFRTYRPTVARWARHRLGAAGDVDDVVQDVFLAVLRRLPYFRHEARISTWLYVITTRIADEHRRRRQRDRLRHETVELGELPAAPLASDPHHSIERRETVGHLERAIAELPDHYRAVLVHFEFEERRARDVAELLGTTPENASVRLFRARRALATLVTRERREPAAAA